MCSASGTPITSVDYPYDLGYPYYMRLGPKNLQSILDDLDSELAQAGAERSLTICGGGALLFLNIMERVTRDVDVITPELDPLLTQLAALLAKRHGLEENWLNNGPAALARDLEPGWLTRTEPIFKGRALELRTLGRRDLIASKLFALCDRDEHDLDDLFRMKLIWSEVEDLKEWILKRDASSYWPERVERQLAKLKKRVENG